MRVLGILGSCMLVLLCLPLAGTAEDIYHDGDLRLSGSQRMVIEDVSYHISGDVYVGGEAQLEIRNSEICFSRRKDDIWNPFAAFHVHRDARVTVQDSVLVAPEGGNRTGTVWFWVRNNSTVVLDGVSSARGHLSMSTWEDSIARITSSSVFHIRVLNSSDVEIADSTIEWAIGIGVSGSDTAELADLRPGYVEHWVIPQQAAATLPRLSISRCSVAGWRTSVEGSVELTLTHCVIDWLDYRVRDPSGTIGRLATGVFEDWSFRDACFPDSPLDVRLVDTEITGPMSISILGGSGPLRLVDSVIADIWIEDFTGKLTVDNCTVTAFQLNDSRMALDLDGTSVLSGFDFHGCSASITGDFAISSYGAIGEWFESSCLRRFTVRVQTPDGTPIAHATGRIEKAETEIRFETDESGRAQVWISFSDSDALQALTVSVIGPSGQQISSVLGLLSSSPVVLILDTD